MIRSTRSTRRKTRYARWVSTNMHLSSQCTLSFLSFDFYPNTNFEYKVAQTGTRSRLSTSTGPCFRATNRTRASSITTALRRFRARHSTLTGLFLHVRPCMIIISIWLLARLTEPNRMVSLNEFRIDQTRPDPNGATFDALQFISFYFNTWWWWFGFRTVPIFFFVRLCMCLFFFFFFFTASRTCLLAFLLGQRNQPVSYLYWRIHLSHASVLFSLSWIFFSFPFPPLLDPSWCLPFNNTIVARYIHLRFFFFSHFLSSFFNARTRTAPPRQDRQTERDRCTVQYSAVQCSTVPTLTYITKYVRTVRIAYIRDE